MNMRALAGVVRHFLLSLSLNFRSRQAIVYGYLMPLFFLLAFGSIFRVDTPPLLGEMGQILTITILGGACFGLPTGLVAERERGVWRRYRLLPVPTAALVTGTLLARLTIVASAAALQIGLARLIYGTPLPLHPLQAAGAFLVVAVSFLGLGLLVAALAEDVPAVQALGQCLFLPMILIGGVGVPLVVLPVWAQRIAGFMPGRYAVEALQRTLGDPRGLTGAGFDLLALLVIGTAAGAVGAKLFRWENGRRLTGSGYAWVGGALALWLAVGATALHTGRLKPILPDASYETITDEQLNAITYEDLPGDNELVTRMAPPFRTAADAAKVKGFIAKLKTWPPSHLDDPAEDIRHLVALATVADMLADLHEAEIARAVFDDMKARFDPVTLRRSLGWVILYPDEGTVVTNAPELGFRRHPPERLVRQRLPLYAKKYLGRLLGKIPD